MFDIEKIMKLIISRYHSSEYGPTVLGFKKRNGGAGEVIFMDDLEDLDDDISDFEDRVSTFANDLHHPIDELCVIYWVNEEKAKVIFETRDKKQLSVVYFGGEQIKVHQQKWKKNKEGFLISNLKLWEKQLFNERN